VGASNARDGAGHTLAFMGRRGTFGASKTPPRKPDSTCAAGFPNQRHTRATIAFVGLMGVAWDIARAIAATAEGGPRRLRVNPALNTELSGVRGDKTHLLLNDSQNGNRENSVYRRINLKMAMLRGAPVRGAPMF